MAAVAHLESLVDLVTSSCSETVLTPHGIFFPQECIPLLSSINYICWLLSSCTRCRPPVFKDPLCVCVSRCACSIQKACPSPTGCCNLESLFHLSASVYGDRTVLQSISQRRSQESFAIFLRVSQRGCIPVICLVGNELVARPPHQRSHCSFPQYVPPDPGA